SGNGVSVFADGMSLYSTGMPRLWFSDGVPGHTLSASSLMARSGSFDFVWTPTLDPWTLSHAVSTIPSATVGDGVYFLATTSVPGVRPMRFDTGNGELLPLIDPATGTML